MTKLTAHQEEKLNKFVDRLTPDACVELQAIFLFDEVAKRVEKTDKRISFLEKQIAHPGTPKNMLGIYKSELDSMRDIYMNVADLIRNAREVVQDAEICKLRSLLAKKKKHSSIKEKTLKQLAKKLNLSRPTLDKKLAEYPELKDKIDGYFYIPFGHPVYADWQNKKQREDREKADKELKQSRGKNVKKM